MHVVEVKLRRQWSTQGFLLMVLINVVTSHMLLMLLSHFYDS